MAIEMVLRMAYLDSPDDDDEWHFEVEPGEQVVAASHEGRSAWVYMVRTVGRTGAGQSDQPTERSGHEVD